MLLQVLPSLGSCTAVCGEGAVATLLQALEALELLPCLPRDQRRRLPARGGQCRSGRAS